MKELYNMELGEMYNLHSCESYTRVPGGWVRDSYCQQRDIMTTSVFIPYVETTFNKK